MYTSEPEPIHKSTAQHNPNRTLINPTIYEFPMYPIL